MSHEPRTSAATEPLIERLRRATIGRYDIYAELGSGGMATVFLALDLALDRKVAIKVLNPQLAMASDNVARFQREAKVAAALDHANIIGILAVGDDPELAYFVMKYVEGSSLDSVIAAEGAQSIAFARSVISIAARALHYAHQRGVVHRDVKPANLMLDLEGRLIVTDFGIAKQHDATGLTVTGSVIGTPYYMSPEQFNGLPVTGATDQYALGVVAFELLTGRQPYQGNTVGEVMRGHLFDPIPSARSLRPDVPEPLDAAITKMLSKAAEDRFATLEDAAQALESLDAADASEARTQIAALARSGAQKRPEIHVPVSPTPVARPRVSAQRVSVDVAKTDPPRGRASAANLSGPRAAVGDASPSARTVPISMTEKKRWPVAALVLLLAVVGAGATIVLRPDLFGVRMPVPADPPVNAVANEASGAPSVGEVANGSAGAGADVTPPEQPGDGTAPPPEQPATPAPAVVDTTTEAAPPPAPVVRRPRAGTAADRRLAQRVRDSLDALQRERTSSAEERPSETASVPAAEPAPVTPPPPTTGIVRIGTRLPLAQISVDGVTRRLPRSVLQEVKLPAGEAKIVITTPRCQPFDTTVTVVAGSVLTIGWRPELRNCREAP